MEQGAGEKRVGIDLDGRGILHLGKPESIIQSLLGKAVFAAEFLHSGEMKEKLVHLLHAPQRESELARTLKIENRVRRGESLYRQQCGCHHRTKCKLLRVALRRFGLLLYQFETALQKAYRFPMRTTAQRLPGSQPEVADGARMIAAILEVTRELIRIRIGQSTVRLFEFLADQSMEA